MKELLEIRKKMKERQPDFIRQDAHKKRLKKRWVKPRGLHSKVRLKHRGHARKVSSGYRTPNAVRGLSTEGLEIKMVYNMSQLEGLDKEKEGVIISSQVGLKNRILLLKKIKEKGINLLNIDIDEYLKRKEEEIQKRKEKRKKKENKKKEERKEEKEDRLEEKLSDEEKKEKEKKEKDKLLTKREK